MRHWFCSFLWIFLVTPAWAATEIKGSINWVSDGDTVWLRPDPGQDLGKVRLHKGRVKLRLAAIDAPESCQDWGAEAAAALRIQLKTSPCAPSSCSAIHMGAGWHAFICHKRKIWM